MIANREEPAQGIGQGGGAGGARIETNRRTLLQPGAARGPLWEVTFKI